MSASREAFLGVESSLTGRRWVGPGGEAVRLAEAMTQETGLHDAVCRLLVARGVESHEAERYLAPSLRDLLPDPMTLRDMEPAAERLIEATDKRHRVAVFADYDVDGGASAALLVDWFGHFGLRPTLYVPDRIDEGYGPNPEAMQKLDRDHDLIICVDCGTLSFEALEAVSDADVLVLDHHLGGETLPKARAVVNPNRQDETGDLSHLCAAAVVFLVLVDVNRRLRAKGIAGPDLMQLLDLVALATVADVAPLTGVNRAFVRQGLHIMRQRNRAGIAALADVAGLDVPPAAYHLGYILGPRINAGGRVGRADLGARCLSTRDPDEARSLAEKLDQLNKDRRDIENAVRDAALTQIEERGADGPLVWAAGDGWHPGVVGIVAARVKEATNRPAVVIGFDGDEGKGSGRSVSGIDLGHSVQRIAAEGLLTKGGGHRMAAGLTLQRDSLEIAMERLSELLGKQGAGAGGPRDLKLDAPLMPGAATVDLINDIETAGPFGQSAPAPRFAFPDAVIHHTREVGTGHLKLTFGDGLGARIDAIAFGAFDGPLGPRLSQHGGARFHLAGRLEINHWGGRQSVQLRLEDAAEAS